MQIKNRFLLQFLLTVSVLSKISIFGSTAAQGCPPTHYTGHSGFIWSPNYPQTYTNNAKCTYQIAVSEGFHIQLSFLHFYTESKFDYLTIYDGNSVDRGYIIAQYKTYRKITNSQMLVYFSLSGLVQPGTVIYAGLHTVTAVFISDSSVTFSGFNISWTAVQDICGNSQKVFTLAEGLIQSLNWPHHYPNMVDCTYKIIAPFGYKVYLAFNPNSSTELGYDEITVKKLYGSQIATFSGSGASWPPILTYSSLELIFQSDSSITGVGYNGSYTITPDNTASGCQCGPRNRSLSKPDGVGSLFSPCHPSLYQPNTKCTWTLEVLSGYGVRLSFPSFKTEYTYDTVEVFAGSSTSGIKLQTCSGEFCSSVRTVNSAVTLVFSSDGSGQYAGFNAVWAPI